MLFGKMSGFARLMFVVGSFGVIACTIRLVQAMITEGFADAILFFYLLDGIYLLVLAAKVFWMPLSVVETSDMLSGVFSRRVLVVLKSVYVDFWKFDPDEAYASFLTILRIFMFIGVIYPFPMLTVMVGSSSTPILAVTGACACWLYNTVWLVRFWISAKKNSPIWQ